MAKEWIDDYNYNRPHTILNKLSPVEYLMIFGVPNILIFYNHG